MKTDQIFKLISDVIGLSFLLVILAAFIRFFWLLQVDKNKRRAANRNKPQSNY